MLEKLDVKEWLELNAKLQQKKNGIRGVLKDRGILKREGNNSYDKYKYFSEAQYKALFTELFHDFRLELNFSEVAYDTFDGTEKQSNGRMPKVEFFLIDIDTGFYESTIITGEGMDKGDKAGYKAYTGALKYFFADKFMVATGDDPENDSPSEKMNQKKTRKASKDQIAYILSNCSQEEIIRTLDFYHIGDLADLEADIATKLCMKINKRKGTIINEEA